MGEEAGQRRRRADVVFFFQAEDGIRDIGVTGVQTCALPISMNSAPKLPAIENSHDVAGICVAWARIAATFSSAYSCASTRAAISASGVANGDRKSVV